MIAGKKPQDFADGQDAGKTERDEMDLEASAATDPANVVLDARIQARIGLKLSAYYSELVGQPVPDIFVDLLKKLEKSEKGA